MRIRSWTAFFSEGILVFWNSSWAKDYSNADAANIYLGPKERGYVRALQDFTTGTDPSLQPSLASVATAGVRAYGLKSSSSVLAYLHHFANHDTPVSATVTLESPIDGTLTWIDPSTGQALGTQTVSQGSNQLTSPPFAVDMAGKIQ